MLYVRIICLIMALSHIDEIEGIFITCIKYSKTSANAHLFHRIGSFNVPTVYEERKCDLSVTRNGDTSALMDEIERDPAVYGREYYLHKTATLRSVGV